MRIEIGYLVPSFNHERYVLELLESIKCDADTLNASWELLIIDDGSTDSSERVIRNWVESSGQTDKIKFIARENQGLSATLNQLITTTNAEYLRLCASDDLVVPGSTARMWAMFRDRPALLCVAGDGIVIGENGKVISQSSVRYHGGDMAKLLSTEEMPHALIRNWCLAGPSLLIRRTHYQSMRYDESLSIDDFDLFLSLLAIPESLMFIDIPVCHYRVHSTNTSKSTDPLKRIRNLRSFSAIISKHAEKGLLTSELIPLLRKTEAKIAFLERNYFKCIAKLVSMWRSKVRMGSKDEKFVK